MARSKNKGHALERMPSQDVEHNTAIVEAISRHGNSKSSIGESQRTKQLSVILQALRQGELSSVAARERLGVLHPAGRVCDLRRAGYKIETIKRKTFDAEGRPHYAGVYVLKSGAP